MRAKRIVILALALSLPAASLIAQDTNQPPGPPPDGQNDGPPGGDGGPGPGRHHRPPPMPLIQALDTNHDGVLDAAEIANAPAALKTLDKNGDGQLTKDEYLPPRPPRGGQGGQGDQPSGPPPDDNSGQSGNGHPHHHVPPIVSALDTNGDGIISADEIANASASLLKLDKNGDGKLTMDELMGPRPQRPGNGDGGNDGPPPDDGNGPTPPPPGQNNQ